MVILIATLGGLMVGSAINAAVWRLKVGKSWVKGRSECPDCSHPLAPGDLVPVLSWLALRGRCRYCHRPIARQYPAVELATALLFGVSMAVLAPVSLRGWITTVIWLWLLVQLIILAVYDRRWMILPNRVTLPAIAVAAAQLVVLAAFGGPTQAWLGPLEAAAIAGGAFWILANVAGGRLMGGGDVKLVVLMGLLLGVSKTALALLIGFDSAAIVGLVLILTHKRSRRDYLPFGPFLIGGTIVAYLWGGPIIDWYVHANGL